jgi:ATP-dependent DNA ligase
VSANPSVCHLVNVFGPKTHSQQRCRTGPYRPVPPYWVAKMVAVPATGPGHDWTGRFPLIARAALSLKAGSCLIDGEAVACDDNGLPVFDRLRYRRDDRRVFLYGFDLIELDGRDLRREPVERRKVLLIRLLAKASVGLQVNDHIVEPGDVVFRHACQLGFGGIVSKRLGSPYVSGRSRTAKFKNRAVRAGRSVRNFCRAPGVC